jgi:uncharacterized membrane protein YeaQ/YmgE (transglycosylase-associated protein family)
MELSLSLGVAGWLALLIGAVVIGVVAQLIGEAESGYEWLATSIAAGIGALVASELIVGLRAFEPVFDGLALVPALIGGLVVGLIVAVAARTVTGGHYLPRSVS